jgi:hypothetical protein
MSTISPDYRSNLPYQLYKYFFNSNTPNLAEGVPILTPDPDDVILGASIFCSEAFNAAAVADLVFQGAADNVQTLSPVGTLTAGNFTVGLEGVESGNIPYNATSAAVQTALQSMSNIGAGNALVTGATGGPWTVTFTGALADAALPELTVNSTGLTGGTVAAAVSDSGIFAKFGSGAVNLDSVSAQYGITHQPLADVTTKLHAIDPPPASAAGVQYDRDLLLVVNQTGLIGGAASTATQGQAAVYIAVAQPISINPTDVPLPLN